MTADPTIQRSTHTEQFDVFSEGSDGERQTEATGSVTTGVSNGTVSTKGSSPTRSTSSGPTTIRTRVGGR